MTALLGRDDHPQPRRRPDGPRHAAPVGSLEPGLGVDDDVEDQEDRAHRAEYGGADPPHRRRGADRRRERYPGADQVPRVEVVLPDELERERQAKGDQSDPGGEREPRPADAAQPAPHGDAGRRDHRDVRNAQQVVRRRPRTADRELLPQHAQAVGERQVPDPNVVAIASLVDREREEGRADRADAGRPRDRGTAVLGQ